MSSHEIFDFVRFLDNAFGEYLAAVFCDKQVVFDADADFPFVDVQARLVGDDAAIFQLDSLGGDIVDVNAQMVGDTVHIVFADAAFVGNQPQLHAALGQNLFADFIQIPGGHAGLGLGGHLFVGPQNNFVYCPLPVCELAVYGVGSGDVGAVAIHPGAQIQQEQAPASPCAIFG